MSHFVPRRHPRSRATSSRVSTVGRRAGRITRSIVKPWQRCAEHLAIEKQQRRERLILRGRRHRPFARQMVQERCHLRLAQIPRMPLPGKAAQSELPPVRCTGNVLTIEGDDSEPNPFAFLVAYVVN